MTFGFSTMGAPGLTLAESGLMAEAFDPDFVELRAKLARIVHYQGRVLLEWEKPWHAGLPDLREALAEPAPFTSPASPDTAQ